MPGLLKIGCTERSPHDRARELSTTELPGKFVVVFDVAVSDHEAAEKAVHDALATHREVKKREFFRVDLDVAITKVRRVADLFPGDTSPPAGRVVVAGVVDNEGKVLIDGVRWSAPPHGLPLLDVPVDALLSDNRDDEHMAELENRLAVAEKRAEAATHHWLELREAWFKGAQKEAALEESMKRDAELDELRQSREDIKAGKQRWKRTEKPGYWYYEGKIYHVKGDHLTAQEQLALVHHFAESARENILKLAAAATEMRAKNRK